MSKYYIGFLVIISLGLGAYYIVHAGHYPVAVVNGSIISQHALTEEYAAAFQYYSRVLAKEKQVDFGSTGFQKELRRAALNDLIEKSLITGELKKRIGGALDVAVQTKINDAKLDEKQLVESAQTLYGLNLADFKNLVLIPAAEKDLLQRQLSLENKKLEDWLAAATAAARVTLLTSEFSWATNKVISR